MARPTRPRVRRPRGRSGGVLRRITLLSLASCAYALVLLSCVGPPGSSATPLVLVYGDSLWDAGQVLDDCDLCSLFTGDFEIRNFAHAGAKIWHQTLCDGTPVPDPDCRNGVDRALPCWAEVEGLPTCLGSNADADVLLVQFGTNDVRVAGLDPSLWSDTYRPLFVASLRSILAAKPGDMACVLVVPPPIWSPGYEVFNALLEDVEAIVHEQADASGCVVADLLSTYMAVEAAEGPGATLDLYRDCVARGEGSDCVHYAIPRSSLPAGVIDRAIEEAIRLPEPAPRDGAVAALSAVVVAACAVQSTRLRPRATRGPQGGGHGGVHG